MLTLPLEIVKPRNHQIKKDSLDSSPSEKTKKYLTGLGDPQNKQKSAQYFSELN